MGDMNGFDGSLNVQLIMIDWMLGRWIKEQRIKAPGSGFNILGVLAPFIEVGHFRKS